MNEVTRVEPADPGTLDDDVAALVSLTENADGRPLRVIATLAHRADLVALRAAWRHGSDYEWGHHVE